MTAFRWSFKYSKSLDKPPAGHPEVDPILVGRKIFTKSVFRLPEHS